MSQNPTDQNADKPVILPADYQAAPFSPETLAFVDRFAKRYSAEAVLGYLDSAGSKRVLLVGESIIDEYQYCEALGKSGKEPILAVKYGSTEKFAGGVLAMSNQVAELVTDVGLVSALGTVDSHETFIRERLNPRIDAMFLYQAGAPTILKRRFLETYPFQKLFEVYVMNDEINGTFSQAVQARLRQVLPRYDVVIVVDYGHGLLSPEVIDLLCNESRFLAVNTQTNAANRGFNTVSKYHRADYICISEQEFRLEARSRTKEIETIVSEIAPRLGCERVMLTRGPTGCLCYQKGEGFCRVPAFTVRIVDRIGAGDAVLAVTAPCVAAEVPLEVAGLIGNVAGALAVETVGHRNAVTRGAIREKIASLLDQAHGSQAHGSAAS